MTTPAIPSKRVTKSAEVIDLILESVSAGTPLAEVCRQEWAPSATSFYSWLNADPELDARFAQARELGQAAIEAHSRFVARGEQGYSSGDVKRDKLIVETNDRMLDRWDRRYRTATEAADGPTALGSTADLEASLCDILARAAAQRAYEISVGHENGISSTAKAYGRFAEVTAALAVIEEVVGLADLA